MRRLLWMPLFLVLAAPAWAMDSGDVVKMLHSRVDERTIIRTVQAGHSPLFLDRGGLDRIRRAGGSEYLVQNLCALSRPPLAYTAPVVVTPIMVQEPGRVDKDSTLFEIVNQSGRDFAAEINHDARRIVLRDAARGGMRVAPGTTVRLVVRRGDWKVRCEGYADDGEVKMRGGRRTVLRLERLGGHHQPGVLASVDDSERVRTFTLIPEGRMVIVNPAPVVVQQPTYVVESNPVIVTPAPIIRPAPVIVRPAPPPPVIVTPMPGHPPVVMPRHHPPPRKSTGININFSYNDRGGRRR